MSVGAAIRAQRQARGWSLGDVEERSSGRVKASVLGAYERDERAISTRRLELVADVLGVPVQALLGSAGGRGAGTTVTVTLTIHGADQQAVMTAAAELVAAVETTGLEVVVPAAAAA